MASYPFYRIGFWIRETGQALDKLGCFFQGNGTYAEQVFRHRTLFNLYNRKPVVHGNAFVAPSASLVGDVSVGQGSSIWYGTVLRGDAGKITVGDNTSIQDGTIIRTAKARLGSSNGAVSDTVIGTGVTVGHGVSMHAATVGDGALIGTAATLLEGCTVEQGAMVAAGAVVHPGTVVPTGELWGGNPAVKLRDMKTDEVSYLPRLALAYTTLGGQHSKTTPKSLQDLVDQGMEMMKAEDVELPAKS
mmetsp:Transcript_12122/g.36398  ORF Transcript_12122/g.36398 Transcript_12122/m.36398 type:complete len:246 (-) Transcript_12122:662-1399(-)